MESLIRKVQSDPAFLKRCFVDISGFKNTAGISALRGKILLSLAANCPIAGHIKKCVEQKTSAWNYSSAGKFLWFVMKNKWLKSILITGLNNIQSGTQAGEPVEKLGEVVPRVRIDKPWGWEIILTTVREKIGDAEEGYTEKYLIVSGPLSNQIHEDYSEGGKEHPAKVETQTSYGPSPYLLRINANKDNEELYEVRPGGIFHIAKNTWHQPSVRPGDIAIVKETSKPNIGPGSTTRNPGGDPWKAYRSQTDY